MPKFTVEAKSSHNPADTYGKVKTLLNSDADLKRMDSSYVCLFDDGKLSGTAKGSKFSASLTVKPESGGSKVCIDVDLPLLLTPVKGIVQSTLQKKLDKALA